MEIKPLHLPDKNIPDFKKNFIKTAVCELRFPILLELEKSAPSKFHSSLRKDFPLFERRASFNIATETKESAYVFSSKLKKYILTVKPSSISLETSIYNSFSNFITALTKVINAANSFIDADFYIRIGLRYIDVIPFEESSKGWINDDLISPLDSGQYGIPEKYWHIVRGIAKYGKYTFQYGIENADKEEYILDFDFYEESIETKDAINVVKKLHKESLSLFKWSIGEKSISYLVSGS